MEIDPKVYVVAHKGGFAVLPFDANIACALADAQVFTPDEVLKLVKDVDVSLVWDSDKWTVEWKKGSEIEVEDLFQIRELSLKQEMSA